MTDHTMIQTNRDVNKTLGAILPPVYTKQTREDILNIVAAIIVLAAVVAPGLVSFVFASFIAATNPISVQKVKSEYQFRMI